MSDQKHSRISSAAAPSKPADVPAPATLRNGQLAAAAVMSAMLAVFLLQAVPTPAIEPEAALSNAERAALSPLLGLLKGL